ncbi:MAG: hypothetical protein HYZ28_10605 [Myxococcales bacterium]|nr:hypothetical protein [Myxococcales bacterium]
MEEGEGLSAEAKPEGEMTHEELQKEAEKQSEAWTPWNESHEDRENKLERDQEQAREEAVKGKDEAQKPNQKEGARNALARRGAHPAHRKAVRDGFERSSDPVKAALAKLEQAAAATALRGVADPPPLPRPDRPMDAMALLHAAQDPGILFREDAHREGHSEEQEDPELAAAVEECIRLLFTVRGILRVGPGQNDRNEPVIVIVLTRGFGEAQLRAVPPKVHRFPTLLAIPYDLLPLRRER